MLKKRYTYYGRITHHFNFLDFIYFVYINVIDFLQLLSKQTKGDIHSRLFFYALFLFRLFTSSGNLLFFPLKICRKVSFYVQIYIPCDFVLLNTLKGEAVFLRKKRIPLVLKSLP